MPRFAANLSMLYNEIDFLDRFTIAAIDGFKGVEFLFPYDYPANVIAEKLTESGLTQVLFNMPPGDWAKGERGIAILPDRIEEFRTGVTKAIDYAKVLGCKQLHCMAGIIPEGASRVQLTNTYIENLKFAAAATKRAGIKLLVEPVNSRDMPSYYLGTPTRALEVLLAVGSDNLFIQYDLYHAQIMQGDLTPTFLRLRDRIAHIQVADTPGRNEPGTGEINYNFIFNMLDAVGYDGWVGCEYIPKTSTSDGLSWAAPWLGR